MDKIIELIFSNALGAIGLTVVGWLISRYVDQINQRLEDHKKTSLERISELSQRISHMESKYRDVLDIVVDKFSKWEDRILGLFQKIQSTNPVEMKSEIDKFKQEAKDDIQTIKLRVEKVSSEVRQMLDEPMIPDSEKQQMMVRIKDFQQQYETKIKYIDDSFSKVLKLIKAMNQKQKEHEFKISNLIATRKSLLKDE